MDEQSHRGGQDVFHNVAGPVDEVRCSGSSQRQVTVDRHAEDAQGVVEQEAAAESADEQCHAELHSLEATHGPASGESGNEGVEGERNDVASARSGEDADSAAHPREDRQTDETEDDIEQGGRESAPRPEHHSTQGDREGLQGDRHAEGADRDWGHHGEGCDQRREYRDESDIRSGRTWAGDSRRGGAVSRCHEYSIVRGSSGSGPGNARGGLEHPSTVTERCSGAVLGGSHSRPPR